MLSKNISSTDKSFGKKNVRSDSQGFGKDIKNIFIPKRTTIKREKSKISLCAETKIALNP